MGTELIQAKLGFDTSEFVAGTDAAKARAQMLEKDMLKADAAIGKGAGSINSMAKNAEGATKQIKGINESLGMVGLSTIAPLAAIGKLTMAVYEFGKNAKDSSNDAERALYGVTTSMEGIGSKTVEVAGRMTGMFAMFIQDSIKFGAAGLEQMGLLADGTSEYVKELDKAEGHSARIAAQEALVKKETAEINALKKAQAEQDFAALPISEQIAKLSKDKQAAEEKVKAAGDDIVLGRKAELELMKANSKLSAAISKQTEEEHKSEIKSREVLAKAQADFEKKKQADANETAKKSRLSHEEEIELVKLTSKNVDLLTRGERERLQVLMDQKKIKALQAEIDTIIDAKNGVLTAGEKARVVELDRQIGLINQQASARSNTINATKTQSTAEAVVTDEIKAQNAELVKQAQIKAASSKGTFTYNGDTSSLTNYQLNQQLNKNRALMNDLKVAERSSPIADSNYFEQAMVKSVTARLQAEVEKREEERKLEVKSKAYDEAKYGRDESSVKFDEQTKIFSQMNARLDELTKMWKNEGLSVTPKSQ